ALLLRARGWRSVGPRVVGDGDEVSAAHVIERSGLTNLAIPLVSVGIDLAAGAPGASQTIEEGLGRDPSRGAVLREDLRALVGHRRAINAIEIIESPSCRPHAARPNQTPPNGGTIEIPERLVSPPVRKGRKG